MNEKKIVRAYLLVEKNGQRVTAFDGMRGMLADWDLRIDWHEFSYVLDEMTRTGEAVIVPAHASRSSYTEYAIRPKTRIEASR